MNQIKVGGINNNAKCSAINAFSQGKTPTIMIMLEPGSQIAQTNTTTTTITITIIIMTNLGFLITASLLHNNKRRLARTNTHIHSPRHSSIKKLRYD